jgi:hypothetical protein
MKQILSSTRTLVGFILLFCFNHAIASPAGVEDGVLFNCGHAKNQILLDEMIDFLDELQIKKQHYTVQFLDGGNLLRLVLATPDEDQNTLNLAQRSEYQIQPDMIRLPIDKQEKPIVSKKEIVLALLQHGRRTEFEKEGCSFQSFKDHVGIRQNIVAWNNNKRFIFPGKSSGNSSAYNPVYWKDYNKWKTDPEKYAPIAVQAIHDVFVSRGYRMGCLSVAKVSMLHGITDYYTRVRPDEEKLKKAIYSLFAYGAPLQDPEPGYIWKDFRSTTAEELNRKEGKFLEAVANVSKFNFVPGDWAYFKNTHEASSNTPGDEGSNAIYLGGNDFNNFYDLPFSPALKGKPYPSTYTTEQKVSIIASWGGKVPTGKVVDRELFNKLMEPPDRDQDGYIIFKGGFLLKHRLTPRVF